MDTQSPQAPTLTEPGVHVPHDPTEPPEVADELKGAFAGAKLSPEEEKTGLDFFLDGTDPGPQNVRVEWLTPLGSRWLIFRINPQDSTFINELEDRHTTGKGTPQEKLDEQANNAELIYESLVEIIDEKSGARVDPHQDAFRGGLAAPYLALHKRFGKQDGLMYGIASEVRRVSGWSPDRVGRAQRDLVQAAGG